MAKRLPYRVSTASGETIDIDFALHAQTVSPMDVGRLLSAVLETVDRELEIGGETGNGDVLQALAMALAVRAGMIRAPHAQTSELAGALLSDALAATGSAGRRRPPVGHA